MSADVDAALGSSGTRSGQVAVHVTFFSDHSARKKHAEDWTLAALAQRINAVTAATKAKLPWLKLARFGEARTDRGNLRHDANVLAISGIEADYDGKQMSFDDACAVLQQQGISAIVYTSPSHTDDAPKWRVLCPISTEMPPTERDKLLGRLNGLFQGIFATESWTLSQAYYYGSVNHSPSHRVQVIDGTPIDLHDELDAISQGRPNGKRGESETPRHTSPLGLKADEMLDVSAALAVIPNDGGPDWVSWNRVGMATWAATGGDQFGFEAWRVWSVKNPADNEAVTRDPGTNMTLPTDPPQMIAKVILSRFGQWTLPKLAGVITTPTLRPDGTVLSKTGYDEVTRLYVTGDPRLVLPPMSDNPTRTDAEAALATLLVLLRDFPFVSEVHRAVALSGLITSVARGAMAVAPLHAFTAPTPGSGKSYFVDLASTISTGKPCPVMAAGRTEEETEKRLVGMLLAGTPVIAIDNLNGELGGDFLCQAVERPLVAVRRLGSSDIFEIESRATLFATGNALRLRGDMVRRAIVASLDARMERPELRQFEFKPVEMVHADRGRYVAACLTIVRAYLAAGMPDVLPPLASFEEWSDRVRSTLVWLGCADPVESMEQAREADPELNDLREMLAIWEEHFSGAGATAREAAEKASGRFAGIDWNHPVLRDVLLRIAGDRGTINTRKLGNWLADHENRPVDGRKFERAGIIQHAVRWRVGR